MKVSARNVLEGKVTSITEGAVSALVTIDVGHGQLIHSTITMASLKELELAPGKEAYAIVKASDVIVGVPHHKR